MASEESAGDLHAVADAQDWNAHAQDLGIAADGVIGVGAGGPSREDDASYVQRTERFGGDVGGKNQRVNVVFACPTGNEPGILRAEIDDSDGLL